MTTPTPDTPPPHGGPPRAQAATEQTATGHRPGWPEIIVGLVAYLLAYLASPVIIDVAAGDDAVVRGLAAAALSGLVGLVGFAAAFLVRIRSWGAFGIRRVGARWLLLGLAIGLSVFVASRVVFAVLIATGTLPDADPQGDYRAAAGGGTLALVAQLVLIAGLTPIGEELLFRGVLVTALRRYGVVLSIAASSVLFLIAHGLNLTLLPALLVGVASALLLLRTRSIWPGVLVHAMNNGLGTVLEVVVPTLTA